ncbi:MAG: Gfo/Idh/MocA family oxidoreductase [Pseudotabrizicola sp.]|uniref:Gfo/Idh/MocA family protein n=1 Tax=Pseudotabrizicola sp. TaxID=2939647 RepID=UPI002715D1FF|nr:Gfo/Idh/MocA family oxidoreductase [Pseudotabrizicola sp.]MDO9641243.1 Gfo/Idh/MocA family oxidoreductase [Pseudotabrizicola sp.]
MPKKDERLLRVGVLGCGPIAQAAHFESCTKARNAELYAICDVADDLRDRMAATHAPRRSFADYDAMLADPDLEAVIIATSDAFHVAAARRALEAGKHVLCEKPLATGIEEAESLRGAAGGLVLQVGHMKRYDAGLQAAKAFIDGGPAGGMGEMVALKAWYCDSTHRYPMTDAVQPLMVASAQARKPAGNPKADLDRYYMLAHGSHLVDTARYFAGELVAVDARLSKRGGMHCWFVDVEFASGVLGHLDLTVAVRMDWHEGFQIYGAGGSVLGKTYNPWYYKTSEVDIFHESDGATRRVLGADGHFYRRQVEGFAQTVLTGQGTGGADLEDGIASVRAMVAIAQSARSGQPVRLADVSGSL